VIPLDTKSDLAVESRMDDKPILKLETICVNQDDQTVIRGEATVLFSA
jgi:hypothetical protein